MIACSSSLTRVLSLISVTVYLCYWLNFISNLLSVFQSLPPVTGSILFLISSLSSNLSPQAQQQSIQPSIQPCAVQHRLIYSKLRRLRSTPSATSLQRIQPAIGASTNPAQRLRRGGGGRMNATITVMILNLHDGEQPPDSPNAWEKRRDLCVSVITSYSPTILCTQQGLRSQLDFLQQCLSGYSQFGVSRKGAQDTTDEYCTIFYDGDKVELLEGGTFWLSESPSVPGSTSWGSAVPCIATWATFQLKGVEPPGFSFQVVNTNLDEFSPRARRRSALLTWQHIASLPPNLPVVYCGGFNTQKESMTGRFLLGRSREHGVVGDMRDAWPSARLRKNVSLIHTYHGFKGDKQGAMESIKLIFRALCLCWDRQTQDLHIDWVLFRGRSLVPASCEVISDNIDGFYPSSHYPICAEFMLPRTVRLLDTS